MTPPEPPFRAFLRDLGAGRVLGVVVAYVVLAAGAIGLAADVEEGLRLPGWTDTVVIVIALAGLPVAVLVAWVLDLRSSAPSQASSVEPRRRPREREASKSVVVVPFDSVGSTEDQEYFSDGLTDEIITDLSMVGALRVIARGSSMKLKHRNLDYPDLADLLDVGYAVEGSVRRGADALRVSAHLVELSSGTVLWGDRYEGSLEDVFEIQESVAASVVEALRVRLSPREEARLKERPMPDAVAYDEYLRARPDIYAMQADALARAERHLQRALEICPETPLLLKGMGLTVYQRYNTGVEADPALLEDVLSYADRIEALDPEGGDAEMLRGLVAEYSGPDVRQGVRHLRRAYAADPDNLDTRLWLSVASMSTGQLELATSLAEGLARVDPLAPLPHLFVAYAAYFDGRPGDGAPRLERAMELGADVPPVWWAGVRIRLAAGDIQGAREAVAHLKEHHAESPFRAIRWLERSLRIGFINYRFSAEHDPHLESLRGREDFQRYLDCVREAQEEFEAKLDPVVA